MFSLEGAPVKRARRGLGDRAPGGWFAGPSMSRIPVSSHHNSPPLHSDPFQSPTPMSYPQARPSPAGSRTARPESVYSQSNLSASTAATSADGSLTETRKRQNKRDEVSRACVSCAGWRWYACEAGVWDRRRSYGMDGHGASDRGSSRPSAATASALRTRWLSSSLRSVVTVGRGSTRTGQGRAAAVRPPIAHLHQALTGSRVVCVSVEGRLLHRRTPEASPTRTLFGTLSPSPPRTTSAPALAHKSRRSCLF